MKAQVAFYRAYHTNAKWYDKLIAWWTKSNYSHCELVIDDTWYSCSPRDGKVRDKQIIPKKDHWDFIDVEIDKEQFLKFFYKNKDKRYDWKNIFCNQIIPCGLQNPSKWICSEFVGTAIFGKEFKGSPQDLYIKIKGDR